MCVCSMKAMGFNYGFKIQLSLKCGTAGQLIADFYLWQMLMLCSDKLLRND